MDNKIIVKTFEELTNKELYELLKLRFEVFVLEQECRYLDPDGIDYSSIHIFIKNEDGSIAACTRLFAEDEEGVWHVGRVVARSRGNGVGKKILEATAQVARERGASRLRLEGQVRVIGFYEKCGFRVCSEPFDEAGIPHVEMEMSLK
jgi:ElaA protein